MEKQSKSVVSKFYAITFEKELIEFIVYDDQSIECPKAGIKDVYLFHLKPRFVLYSREKGKFEYRIPHLGEDAKTKADLMAKYVIDSDTFKYLKEHGMITYSEDMAYLYQIDDSGAFDKDSVQDRYKKALKRGPILKKQRKGIFD